MRYVILPLILFCFSANAQTINWAVGYGNTQHVNPQELDVDAAGNVVIVGSFVDSLDFDPDTTAVHKIGAVGPTSASSNLYIQKLDVNGNFLWVKQLAYNSGTSHTGSYKVKFDAAGNILVAGSFTGTVDFDPGPATQNITSTNNSDGYLLKLDASGNFVWVRTIAGNSGDIVKEMEVENSGNIYLSGSYFSTIDLDPGAGVQQFTSAGSRDIFLAKWDANGNFVWAYSYGDNLSDEPYAMELDNSGNVILVGTFRDTVDFDPGPGTQQLIANTNEGFVLKVDPNGNTIFVKQLTERNINEVALDNDNNILLTGRFTGTVDFNPNAGVNTETSNGSLDVFVVKWDSTGNYVWSASFGGFSGEVGYHIVTDDFNRVFTYGNYASTTDFDPSTTNFFLPNVSSDVFLSILDANGNFLDAKRFTSSSTDRAYAMEIRNNCVYMTGTYNATMDFAPTDGHYYSPVYVPNGTDAFVVNFCYGAPLPLNDINLSALLYGDNIQVKWTTLEEKNLLHHIIQWSGDGINFKNISIQRAKNESKNEYKYFQPTTHSQNYYRIKSVDLDGAASFSNIVKVKIDDQNEIKIYPNPAQSSIQTNLEDGWQTEIYNSLGQPVLQSKSNRINVEKLQTGVYLIRAIKGNNMKHTRFLKE